MWFSQSCTIGCKECNISVAIGASMYGEPGTHGDLCPTDSSGNKTATVNDPEQLTWLAQGCFLPGTRTPAPCTESNKDTDWTRHHPWRKPGSAPMYDPCGVAGGSSSNNSNQAGGWGYATGYPQGFAGSKLPPAAGPKEVWTAGSTATVEWTTVANHGGGYQYSLCPASSELTEECFHRFPLEFASNKQTLRYHYLNDTGNQTEVEIDAVRISEGTVPGGSTWSKLMVPCGSFEDGHSRKTGGGNGYPPQFAPPSGCDEHCWGYQPCDIGFTHPSYEGWDDPHREPNKWVNHTGTPTAKEYPACANGKDGEGCCHTAAYIGITDEVKVPDVPAGDYVLRWRWDCEMTPQVWAGCGDITIRQGAPIRKGAQYV